MITELDQDGMLGLIAVCCVFLSCLCLMGAPNLLKYYLMERYFGGWEALEKPITVKMGSSERSDWRSRYRRCLKRIHLGLDLEGPNMREYFAKEKAETAQKGQIQRYQIKLIRGTKVWGCQRWLLLISRLAGCFAAA